MSAEQNHANQRDNRRQHESHNQGAPEAETRCPPQISDDHAQQRVQDPNHCGAPIDIWLTAKCGGSLQKLSWNRLFPTILGYHLFGCRIPGRIDVLCKFCSKIFTNFNGIKIEQRSASLKM